MYILVKSYSLLVRLLAKEIYNDWVRRLKLSGFDYVYSIGGDELISTKFENLKNIHTVHEFVHIAQVLYKGVSNQLNKNDICAMTHDVWLSHNKKMHNFSQSFSYIYLNKYNKSYYISAYKIAYDLYVSY
tara:strand:+ start:1034 stop:1423 length:390 start_codon:yes stop_codon:yes gene_type:complete